MKINIQEVSYQLNPEPQPGSGWYTYDEYCDKCGITIRKAGTHAVRRIECEHDYCEECARLLSEEEAAREEKYKQRATPQESLLDLLEE